MVMNMNKTKFKIRHIALQMFQKSSYDEVTINDICKSAGVSKHTFYYYFDSKEDLIKNSSADFKDHLNNLLQEVAMIDNPLDKYLTFTFRRIDDMFELGPEICKRILQMDFEREGAYNDMDDEMRSQFRLISEMRRSLLEKAQEQGYVKNMTMPEKLASYHSAMVHGIIHRWAISDIDMDLKSEIIDASKSLLNYE